MKRILSLLLAAAMLLTAMALCVSAETILTASDDVIRVLKAEEGFSRTPYWDYAQWTVGYGTRCPDDKLEEYRQNGIPEEEAEALLRTFVTRFESEIYGFINRTGVVLSQNQFDALLLFSYNCGSSWSYDASGGLYNAVRNGATGNELIDAFSRWCNAGGQIRSYLLRRRLCEANMYLNGEYSQTPPEHYGYVLYDACGGTSRPNIQGYDTKLTAQIIPTPTYEGYVFDGWYTVDGVKVTVLDSSVKNTRLYAHWLDAEGNAPSQETPEGVKVEVTADEVNIRQGPAIDFPVIGRANRGDTLIITETAEGSGYTWGKCAAGWICMDYTQQVQEQTPEEPAEPTEPTEPSAPTEPEEPAQPETPEPRKGTVKVSDSLRVRSGPSTGYEVVNWLKNGTKVEILEEKIVGAMIWGRIQDGWISLDYVEFDTQEEEEPEQTPPAAQPPEAQPPEAQPPETQPPATQPPATEPPATEPEQEPVLTGTVNVKDFLRVREKPTTTSSVVGYLSPKTRVTITQTKDSESMRWGKTEKGWISLDYVILDKAQTEQEKEVLTGTVKVQDFLRVRNGPGTSYAVAGYLSANAKVQITETRTVGATRWGKTEKGWISLDYVVLDREEVKPEKPQSVTKTVRADCLRIRSNPGTGNPVVGYLYEGAKVEILETQKVNGTAWGRTVKGWISMDYVK